MFWTREKDLQAVRKQKKTQNLTWLSVIVNSLFKKTYFWRERREICVEKANENKQKPTFCLRRSPRFFCFLAGQHCFPNWKQRMFSWRRNNKRTTETAFVSQIIPSPTGFFLFCFFVLRENDGSASASRNEVALTPLRSLTPFMDTRELSRDTERDFGTFD